MFDVAEPLVVCSDEASVNASDMSEDVNAAPVLLVVGFSVDDEGLPQAVMALVIIIVESASVSMESFVLFITFAFLDEFFS